MRDHVLNLGCCDRLLPGAVNVDIAPPADVICDLSQPWPFRDSSFVRAIAHDVLEHLPDIIHAMNELHRVLAPGGIAEIVVPTTDGRGAWQDPTHKSYWNRNTLFYFTCSDPHRERFARHYGITASFRVRNVREEILADHVAKMTALLEAVK